MDEIGRKTGSIGGKGKQSTRSLYYKNSNYNNLNYLTRSGLAYY